MNPKKAMIFALLVLLAVISATRIAPMAADPANHRHSIEKTEEKITSVMTLSGGAAATSATLSLLPGDVCTPIATQLAELAKYFLLVHLFYIGSSLFVHIFSLHKVLSMALGKLPLLYINTLIKFLLIFLFIDLIFLTIIFK